MDRLPVRGLAVAMAAASIIPACGDDSDDTGETGAGTLPLLGTEGDVPERSALAVKVDNTAAGRPPIGVRQADIVYEEMVEGGLTRLLAVYHSDEPETVGPVRSARSTDIPLLAELGRPLFAWSGANPTFAAAVEAADVIDVGVEAAPEAYETDGARSAPYNLDTHPATLRAAGEEESDDQPPTQLFDYRPDGEELAGPEVEEATSTELTGDELTTVIEWEWNEDTSLWERSQDGSPHEDNDGERITAANVIVRETAYEDTGIRDSAGAVVPEAVVVGEGEVVLLSDGQALRGTWSRPSLETETTYADLEGEPLRLAPGQTWIEVLPPGAA